MAMTKEQKDFMKALTKATKVLKTYCIGDGVFHSITFWERETDKKFIFKVLWGNGSSMLINVAI